MRVFGSSPRLARGRLYARGVALVLGAWLAAVEPCWADTASEARLQHELGEELYRQARYAEAVERFIASNRLVQNANVVLNIARTFAFMKRPVDAYNWYVTYLAFELPPQRRELAEREQSALAPEVAVLDVATEPEGAELFVDRTELGSIGRSPRRVAVEPGSRGLIARLARHRDASMTTEAVGGRVIPVELTLAPVLGKLEVTSRPNGAEVVSLVSGETLGRTPLALELAVGRYDIELRLDRFTVERLRVDLSETAPTRLDVVLERDPKTLASLWVRGSPPAAAVSIDDRQAGRTPLIEKLDPGSHRVRVSAQGLEPWQTTVLAEAGATTRIDVSLADPSAGPWPGFRWLGYGLAGGLLATGGVVGLTALDAKSDFDEVPSSAGKERVERLNLTADVLFLSGAVVGIGTLVWDLVRPSPPRSEGRITVSR